MAMAGGKVDVTVRGAGIFGLSVAWSCLRRGARVRVVDPAGPGAGASGGIVGALSPHVPEQWNEKKAFQFEALLAAPDWWSEIELAGGISPGYGRVGRLQGISDEAGLELARIRAEKARALWRGKATWEVMPAKGLAGWVPQAEAGWVVFDTLSARLHPRRALAAMAAAVGARGAEIVRQAGDEGAVVWATGAAGLREMGRGAGIKGQALLVEYDGRGLAQMFTGGLHVVGHADGTVAIGSTSEREYDDPALTDCKLDDLWLTARTLVPVLEGAPVLERWAGERPRSDTRAPLLGPWPGRPGHYVANGGFKIGFGVAPLVGEVMADLVLLGQDGVPQSMRTVPGNSIGSGAGGSAPAAPAERLPRDT